MPFSEKQLEYFKEAHHRWNIKSGATRSGKTYMDYYLIPKRIRAVAGKEGLVVILGNTKGTLQRNIIEPLQAIWGADLVSPIRSDNTAVLFGEKCYCLGADKVSQVNRLRGSSIKYCYGDEVVTWCEDVFTMLKSRLDKPYSRFDGTCNPENSSHWFKKFIDSGRNGDVDMYAQDYQLDDNPFADKAFVENLKNEYRGTVYYDRYILGKWVNAEGLIYPNFDVHKHVYGGDTDVFGRYFISMDYGTLNPCSMGLWCVSGGIAYRVDEYYYSGRDSQRQLTDEDYCDELEKLAGNKLIERVIVDPSAASFKAALKRRGKYQVRDAENFVLDGIRTTSSLLQSGRLLFSDKCRNSIREFGEYCWDMESAEDKPLKENDHAMDDIRYFCATILCRELRWTNWRDKF